MKPYLNFCSVKLYSFPIVFILSTSICIGYLLLSKKYHFMDDFVFLSIDYVFYILLFSILIGKLFSVLSFWIQYRTLDDYHGGFVFYGGIIGGLIGIKLYCIKKEINFIDFAAPMICVLPLGQAIGRIGCYLNGCCYGKTGSKIHVPYIVNGIRIEVFPTWFVESVFCLVLFIILNVIYDKIENKKLIIHLYFICYSLFRFWIEFYRGDEVRGHIGYFSFSQCISIFIILFCFMDYIKKMHRN